MKTLTIRGVDDSLKEALEKRAKRETISVNKTVLSILRDALGLEDRPKYRTYHDLDHLGGTWSPEEKKDFDAAVSVFEQIDDELWE